MTRRALVPLVCLLIVFTACSKNPPPPEITFVPGATPPPAPAKETAHPQHEVILAGLRFSLPRGWEPAPAELTQGMEEPPEAAFWLPGVSDAPGDGNGFPFMTFTSTEGPGAQAGFSHLLANPELLTESVAKRFDESQDFVPGDLTVDVHRKMVHLSYTCLDVDSGQRLAGEDVLIGGQDGAVEIELYSRQKEDAQARSGFETMISGVERDFSL